MIDVGGRWALITGASRGIGRLAALTMAERGCNLILHGRTLEHCQGVLEEVRAKGVEAYAVAAELTELGKPFAVILNSTRPDAPETVRLAEDLEEKYKAPVASVSCAELDAEEARYMDCMTLTARRWNRR